MEVLEPQPSAMIAETQALQSGEALPQGNVPEAPAPAPVEVAPAPEALAPAPSTEGTVEVDGQTFVNEGEALKYLQGRYGELQAEGAITEARVQGMQEAMQYQATPSAPAPVEPVPEVDMDKFYENPTQFLLDRDSAIEQRLMSKVQATQAQTQQDAQVWTNFTAKHPDLADFQGDVEAVAAQHRDAVAALAKRDMSKAMDYVAMKTREKFQRYAEALKPTRTLSNAKPTAVQGGNPTVSTAPQKGQEDNSLDFVSQLRNMRK